jgi:predicted signal transduction protein with EAL and GGDEF domain
LRAADTLARFGGDEFTILLEQVTAAEATARAEQVIASLRAPFTLEGREVYLSASIGIALSEETRAAVEPGALEQQADIALYQAKAAGPGSIAVYGVGMENAAVARLALAADLHRALELGEFVVYYQPIVDLGTQAITGVEALVRWQQPERGLVSPAAFIPLAEETGLIVPLGLWVLEEACRQTHAWQADRPDTPLSVSVNLSPRQLAQPDLVGQVAAVLTRTGLAPERLRLEITESLVMRDPETALTTLDALSALGVRLAIDDFGTGYSSLSYLRRLPVDVVKIDRSFIAALVEDMGTQAIVRAVAELGHQLGMAITAEGVETAAQLALVQALHCDHAQGYYYSAAVPADQLLALLGTERQAA